MYKDSGNTCTLLIDVDESVADEGPGPGSPGTGSNLGLTCSGSFTGSDDAQNYPHLNILSLK